MNNKGTKTILHGGRRGFLKTGASIAGLALAGTLPFAGPARADGTPIKLWHGWTGADNTTALNSVVTMYNEQSSVAEVQPTALAWDDLFSKWVISYASGAAPEILIIHNTEVPEFAKRGMIIPVRGVAGAAGIDLGRLPEGSVKAVTHEGEMHAVPLDVYSLGMYYNVDLVEKAGLDPSSPPINREEFLEWARKLTVSDEGGRIVQQGVDMQLTSLQARWFWYSLLHQFGGSFLGEDGRSALDSEAARKATQFIVDLVRRDKVLDPNFGDTGGAAFTSGRAAIRFTGPWEVNQRMTQGLNFATAKLPTIGDRPATWTSSHCMVFGSGKSDEQVAAAADFCRWFIENYAIPAAAVGIIPITEEARNAPEFLGSPQYPYYESFVEAVPDGVYEPTLENYTEVFSFGKPTPLTNNLQAAISGSKSVEDALRDMKTGVDRQLAD